MSFKVGDKVRVISDYNYGACHPSEKRLVRRGDILTIKKIANNLLYFDRYLKFENCYPLNYVELVEENVDLSNLDDSKLCSCTYEQVIYHGCKCGGV